LNAFLLVAVASEMLTVLTAQEISEVETYWRLVLGL